MTELGEQYPAGRRKPPLVGKGDFVSRDRAIERIRMLSPVSKQKVYKALKKLPPSPDGSAAASVPDSPGYLVYRVDVPGEPEVGIIYRFTQQNKFVRRRYWIADIRGDHLPVD